MKRFWYIFLHEVRLLKSTWIIHLVVLFQPLIMFSLMSLILVHPTFTMYLADTGQTEQEKLITAMQAVGSPIGAPYINIVLLPPQEELTTQQIVSVQEYDAQTVILQQFNLIDSNLVKNFRNRITAAGMYLWHQELGYQPVKIIQKPLLPQDLPYTLYFGMALLPMSAYLAAALIGGLLTALDFEFNTVVEYRLMPISAGWVLFIRLIRLMLSSWLAVLLLLIGVGLITGIWPDQILLIPLIITPVCLIGACVGIMAGLFLQKTLPSFIIGLGTALAFWLLGGAFGLPASFGGTYEAISRWIPHTYSIELLFRPFFNYPAGDLGTAWLRLGLFVFVFIIAAAVVFRKKVIKVGLS